MNYSALISAFIGVGSALSIGLGHPALGATISDPNTATALTAIVGGIASLISAFSPALHQLKL